MKRLLCRLFNHVPYHSWAGIDPQSGYLVSYEISCARCGALLDSFRPDLKGSMFVLPRGFEAEPARSDSTPAQKNPNETHD